jgi:hypothetical protein
VQKATHKRGYDFRSKNNFLYALTSFKIYNVYNINMSSYSLIFVMRYILLLCWKCLNILI